MLNRKFIGIELQEDYIKIGLRRLELQDNYKGEKLVKELKNYEKPISEFALKLFEPDGTSIYGNH